MISTTVNGQSRVPQGFRFHPTEEELLNYYLRKKVESERINLDVIRDVDLNKLEPWDIQEKCRIGSTPQNDWYFFSHKDKKYPTGTRTNRATAAGFWKATGRDKVIYTSVKRIGMRKTLVFYRGRAPHGQKSNWIMHEYRLDENPGDSISQMSVHVCGSSSGDTMGQEEGWVVCRVFKKKNYHKGLDSTKNSSSGCEGKKKKTTTQMFQPEGNEITLDQILHHMERSSCNRQGYSSCGDPKSTSNVESLVEKFMKHENPSFPINNNYYCQITQRTSTSYQPPEVGNPAMVNSDPKREHAETPSIHDWGTVDRLVASHLSIQMDVFEDIIGYVPFCSSTASAGVDYGSDVDLWGAFTAAGSSTSTISDNNLCQTQERYSDGDGRH